MHLKVLKKTNPRLSAWCCVQQRHCSLCERWNRVRLASPSPSQGHNTTVTFVLAFYSEGCFWELDILLACHYYDSLGCTVFPKFTGHNSGGCWWHFFDDKTQGVRNAFLVNHTQKTNSQHSFVSYSASWNLLIFVNMQNSGKTSNELGNNTFLQASETFSLISCQGRHCIIQTYYYSQHTLCSLSIVDKGSPTFL